MATYQTGQSIKYVGSISIGSGTYTPPAGHFAIVGAIYIASTNTGDIGTITIGGAVIVSANNSAQAYQGGDIHVGEGVPITISLASKFVTGRVVGAIFKNSP